MRLSVSVIFLFYFISSNIYALAQNKESFSVARNLGGMLASEKYCNLLYDSKAVSEFIISNVDAKDIEFPGTLQTVTRLEKENLKKLSDSEKAAHCFQVERVAKANGFIK